ncbi:putative alpha-trehalose-phosphate synthase [Paratrimastix pyriformis]|uniref:Alpha-trehalose-phosphate synthase n=1 Tax=Paratrimastix pyriformis TaxID=342808 RepID=A0ABQ8UT01_9EUKA|nr:putative alpha-trehalose-phosphate synthase [Paratrimastix pyriformis]
MLGLLKHNSSSNVPKPPERVEAVCGRFGALWWEEPVKLEFDGAPTSGDHLQTKSSDSIDQMEPVTSQATRILVISNRLPINFSLGDPTKGEPEFVLKPSSGGLVTGLRGCSLPFTWIGWLGFGTGSLPKDAQDRLRAVVQRDYSFIPVFFPDEIASDYYNVYSNQLLWPVFHYQKQNIFAANPKAWAAYQAANKAFAAVVGEQYRPGDLVWVHDYQLCLLPGYLREEHPTMTIGFFLHIPFPSSEVFRTIPQRRILDSLLDANLVGFHAFEFARHFSSSSG